MQDNGNDITTEADVQVMVNSFYEKVNNDPLLSAIFNDFAQVDWDTHLPTMYDFWSTLIFGKKGYKGNPFAAHIPLPVEPQHFERWISLFEENMDAHFSGQVAEHTKWRARSIAQIFQSKLAHIKS